MISALIINYPCTKWTRMAKLSWLLPFELSQVIRHFTLCINEMILSPLVRHSPYFRGSGHVRVWRNPPEHQLQKQTGCSARPSRLHRIFYRILRSCCSRAIRETPSCYCLLLLQMDQLLEWSSTNFLLVWIMELEKSDTGHGNTGEWGMESIDFNLLPCSPGQDWLHHSRGLYANEEFCSKSAWRILLDLCLRICFFTVFVLSKWLQ